MALRISSQKTDQCISFSSCLHSFDTDQFQ